MKSPLRLLVFIVPSVALTTVFFMLNKDDAGSASPGGNAATGLILGIALPAIIITSIVVVQMRSAKRIKRLREAGIPGTARLLHFEKTGLRINRVPELRMKLLVTSSLGQQFEVHETRCVDPIYYSLLQPDTDIPVLIDPAKEGDGSVLMDLDALWQQRGAQPGTSVPAATNSMSTPLV